MCLDKVFRIAISATLVFLRPYRLLPAADVFCASVHHARPSGAGEALTLQERVLGLRAFPERLRVCVLCRTAARAELFLQLLAGAGH